MAANTDKFRKAFNSAEPNVARVSGTRSVAGTTLQCDNLTGWPTDTAVDFVTYRLTTSDEVEAGSLTVWQGVVSGNNVTSLARTSGASDAGNAVNDVVEMVPTGYGWTKAMEGILNHADQDGTLKAGAVDVSAVIAAGILNTNHHGNATITPSKLATGASSAHVVTTQTTTSTTYADLTTTTDSVTVTIGANGLALVSLRSYMANGTVNAHCFVSFEISGATTGAAVDDNAISFQAYAANAQARLGTTVLMTGLNVGSTTFKMKYKVMSGGSGAGTGSFAERKIAVIPL